MICFFGNPKDASIHYVFCIMNLKRHELSRSLILSITNPLESIMNYMMQLGLLAEICLSILDDML